MRTDACDWTEISSSSRKEPGAASLNKICQFNTAGTIHTLSIAPDSFSGVEFEFIMPFFPQVRRRRLIPRRTSKTENMDPLLQGYSKGSPPRASGVHRQSFSLSFTGSSLRVYSYITERLGLGQRRGRLQSVKDYPDGP